jgi:hypothetical protein
MACGREIGTTLCWDLYPAFSGYLFFVGPYQRGTEVLWLPKEGIKKVKN